MKKSVVLLLGLIAAIPNFAPAQSTPAVTISGGGFLGANTGTYGWAFNVSAPVTVTDLGWFDFGGNGLNGAHDVAIWTSTGTLVVSGTVPIGNGDEVNSFNYTPVAATSLAAGDYVIGGFESGESGDPIIVGATITPAANITYSGSRSTTSGGGALAFPSGDAVGNSNSYFGPNFLLAVPEPSATALLLLGGIAAWLRRRQSRSR